MLWGHLVMVQNVSSLKTQYAATARNHHNTINEIEMNHKDFGDKVMVVGNINQGRTRRLQLISLIITGIQ